MTMQEAVERSISAAVEAGTVDADAHAAPLQALRQLAVRADTTDQERDNVTLPTMLKYLTALGMLPTFDAQTEQPKPPKTSLEKMRAAAKFSKLHVA
jgi:hypothetical protein